MFFLDFPSLLSLELVFLVAKASRVLFIISQVFAHVIASGPALLLAVESPGPVVVLDIPFFMIVLAAVGAMLTVSRVKGNGVDCRLVPLWFHKVNSGALRAIRCRSFL